MVKAGSHTTRSTFAPVSAEELRSTVEPPSDRSTFIDYKRTTSRELSFRECVKVIAPEFFSYEPKVPDREDAETAAPESQDTIASNNSCDTIAKVLLIERDEVEQHDQKAGCSSQNKEAVEPVVEPLNSADIAERNNKVPETEQSALNRKNNGDSVNINEHQKTFAAKLSIVSFVALVTQDSNKALKPPGFSNTRSPEICAPEDSKCSVTSKVLDPAAMAPSDSSRPITAAKKRKKKAPDIAALLEDDLSEDSMAEVDFLKERVCMSASGNNSSGSLPPQDAGGGFSDNLGRDRDEWSTGKRDSDGREYDERYNPEAEQESGNPHGVNSSHLLRFSVRPVENRDGSDPPDRSQPLKRSKVWPLRPKKPPDRPSQLTELTLVGDGVKSKHMLSPFSYLEPPRSPQFDQLMLPCQEIPPSVVLPSNELTFGHTQPMPFESSHLLGFSAYMESKPPLMAVKPAYEREVNPYLKHFGVDVGIEFPLPAIELEEDPYCP